MNNDLETQTDKSDSQDTIEVKKEKIEPVAVLNKVLKEKKIKTEAQEATWKLCQQKNVETRKNNKELKLKKKQMESVSETDFLKAQLLLAQRDAEIAQLKMRNSKKDPEKMDEEEEIPKRSHKKLKEPKRVEKKPKKESKRLPTPPSSESESSDESDSSVSSEEPIIPVRSSKHKAPKYHAPPQQYSTQFEFI